MSQKDYKVSFRDGCEAADIFRGRDDLVFMKFDDGHGPITTAERFQRFIDSEAHVFADRVMRYGREIAKPDDVILGEETEI